MNLFTVAKRSVDRALEKVLDRLGKRERADGPEGAHAVPPRLLEAMRYAVLSPGKRLRPALVIGGARAVGLRTADVLAPACAVEMVHAYSLVHDDLPTLDNDELRRGQPTCHVAFDEATALLAGDALLTEALALLSDPRPLSRKGPKPRPRHRARAVRELARATGAAGMVGGQYDDVWDAKPARLRDPAARELAHVLSVHRRKTGRLIQASAALGAIYGGASVADVQALRDFGADVGLAFQIIDDVIDGDGVASIEGVEAARTQAVRLTERGVEHLSRFGRKGRPLAELARAVVERRS